jgi:hypothetical protein
MKKTGSILATGAMASALATLTCCLPVSFLGALGAAGLAVAANAARPWLLGLSVMLLGFGFFQEYKGRSCGVKASPVNLILLAAAAALLVLVALFPQWVASLLADL